MFLYGKKIIYLSRYQDGKREAGAGFVRLTGKSNEWCIEVKARKEFCCQEKDWLLYLLAGNEKIPVENLAVQACGLSFIRDFPIRGEEVFVKGKAYNTADITGIEVRGSDGAYIAGYLKEPTGDRRNVKIVPDTQSGEKAAPIAGEALPRNEEKENIRIDQEPGQVFFAADLGNELQEIHSFDNKGAQLMNDYPQIHPFGDDRVFISIEPKDFIILQASYQKLVNNSFLLHGFYNYRYLILGPDKEIGENDEECFYLGVPGTYFERERMVAVMFGFEGFECAGSVEIGKFGFYMRRVEL